MNQITVLYSNLENLVLRAKSEIEGSASESCDKIPSGDNQSRVLWARIFTLGQYFGGLSLDPIFL
jgi:hypothetical protein